MRATVISEYVQYGCGFAAPEAWRNFDASFTLRFERTPLIGRLYTKNDRRFPDNVEYGDIVKGLPVPDASSEAVYCSHVLEHLALADFRSALINTRKILREGGTFRLVVPDLKWLAARYLADKSPGASVAFVRDTCLGKERRRKDLVGFVYEWLRTSGHLWMWDYESMELELARAGFTDIRRARYGDSKDPMFTQVESADRWKHCLGVECQRHPVGRIDADIEG
jgi:predicted SAM-dependent methyltransferase